MGSIGLFHPYLYHGLFLGGYSPLSKLLVASWEIQVYLGDGFDLCLLFTPRIGEDEPILTIYYCSDGLGKKTPSSSFSLTQNSSGFLVRKSHGMEETPPTLPSPVKGFKAEVMTLCWAKEIYTFPKDPDPSRKFVRLMVKNYPIPRNISLQGESRILRTYLDPYGYIN